MLADIHGECFPHYWNIDAFNDFFGIDNTFALVTPCGNGMVVYRLQYEQAEIITLAVRPSARRKGLAKRLLALAIANIKAAGAHKMFLEVEDGNIAALQLYEGAGFTHVSRRKLYYRQKDGNFTDALVMQRKL